MDPADAFSYDVAFSRNIGLISEKEQTALRGTRIGLPGLGGVGGAHLQTLARLGVGAFHLSDPDNFELVNFNRQLGASILSVGQRKVAVASEIVLGINPHADVKIFSEGISSDSIDGFLNGVDIVVDGIEFFQIAVRELLYRRCRDRGIPVVNAGPIGFGAAVLVFTPDGLSFEEYFGLSERMTRAEKLLAFALGLGLGLKSDIDSTRVDFEREKGPAVSSACMLCAAAAATEVLKILTGRGKLAVAGRGIYFDPLRNRTVPLRRSPSIKTSIRGRLTRWLVFRKIHSLRQMHDQELSLRDKIAGASKSFVNTASI
jgi:molybdopterin-synthase adenylyltransferase